MKALVVVDIQNDFVEGGALAINGGLRIVPLVNELMSEFELVVATQDWHPSDHKSFASNHEDKRPGEIIDLNGLSQVLWPVHCVSGSFGAEFVKTLESQRFEAIFRKGTDKEVDSYSGFFDNGKRKSTGLTGYLREKAVSEVFVCGLATDYCVKATAIDAQNQGFKTNVIVSACAAVNLSPFDSQNAVNEMSMLGIQIISH